MADIRIRGCTQVRGFGYWTSSRPISPLMLIWAAAGHSEFVSQGYSLLGPIPYVVQEPEVYACIACSPCSVLARNELT